MGVSVAPLVVALLAGLAIRYSCGGGSFNLASWGLVLVLMFGLTCSALRHKIWFDWQIKRDADTAYQETLAYAKHIVPAENDDEALRRFMNKNEVAVIGRITPVGGSQNNHNYWQTRNFFHLHWVATRQIILNGQTGVDRSIAEATHVIGDDIFLDKMVAAISKNEPVTDDDLKHFHQYELPFLRQMANGEIAAHDFEQPMIAEARSRLGWMNFAINGFDPFLGMTLLFVGVIIYKLVRQPDEDEMV